MIGSALPNAFRLTICRGCSVHLLLRPAGLLPPLSRAFDTPLGAGGSLRAAGVCYRALRRLPGQDFHLLEQRVFQDAPCVKYINAHFWGIDRPRGEILPNAQARRLARQPLSA